MATTHVGLIGLGVVGQGLYDLIERQPPGGLSVNRIAIKHPNKPRRVPADLLQQDAGALLSDPSTALLAEAIDDADAAFAIAVRALEAGIPLATANKKMVALHLAELLDLQRETGTPWACEAAVCGAIPVLRSLEEHYSADRVLRLEGIVNGTTNYLLTQQYENNLSYAQALREAQELGFAESDPSHDVEGYDALYKLIILAWFSAGALLQPADIPRWGIHTLGASEWDYARRQGGTLRLIAGLQQTEGGLLAWVLPRLVLPGDALFGVRRETNALNLQLQAGGHQTLIGPGAGAFPTASSLLADLQRLRRTAGANGSYRTTPQPESRNTAPAPRDSWYAPVRLRAPEGLVEVLIPRRERAQLQAAETEGVYEGLLSLEQIRLSSEPLARAGGALLLTGEMQHAAALRTSTAAGSAALHP